MSKMSKLIKAALGFKLTDQKWKKTMNTPRHYMDWHEYACGCISCFDLSVWSGVTVQTCNQHKRRSTGKKETDITASKR